MFAVSLSLLLLISSLKAQNYCPSFRFRDDQPPPFTRQVETRANLPTTNSGSWILRGRESELVDLPAFPTFPDSEFSSRVRCPHLATGLKLFHDPTTWPGGILPQLGVGRDIRIPANTRVLLSSCSIPGDIKLGKIFIPRGSALIFDDAEILITVRGISVAEGGSLLIGSETCRLTSRINIVLHGNRPSDNPTVTTKQLEDFKGIAVNGTVDIHGALYHPTWSRLATSANAQSIWLYLQDQVNWEVGQQIVVATTTMKDSRDYHENEIKTIKEIYWVPTPGIMAIKVDSVFKYRHYGGKEYQAEVGLLSRRINIQGSQYDSEPTDDAISCSAASAAHIFTSYPCGSKRLTGYGGHLHIQGGFAVGRISGVLFERMGQTNFMGRYPVHFHLLGENGKNSFVQDSSIWKSYFRCVAVHGGFGVRVSRNVAHDAIGHCFYLEDGIEERNMFDFNFGSLVHFFGTVPVASTLIEKGQYLPVYYQSSTLLLPADVSASVFYITNLQNTFIGNAASGGWSGFSFPTLKTPIGPSRYSGVKPNTRPTLKFDGNTAHSSGFYWRQGGGCMYSGGVLEYQGNALTYTPGRGGSKNTLQNFQNTKVFLCSVGLLHWGDRSQIESIEIHDTLRAMSLFGTVGVKGALIGCRSANKLSLVGTWYEKGLNVLGYTAFQWYDVWQQHILTDVTFRNCISDNGRRANIWEFLINSDFYLPDAMQVTRNIKYENVDLTMLVSRSTTKDTTSGRLANWVDLDGSAVLKKEPSIIGSQTAKNWYKLDNLCTSRTDGKIWICGLKNRVTGKDRAVGSIELSFDSVLQSNQNVGSVICGNSGELPCPFIGTAMHLGYNNVENGLVLTPNTKVTGPINGFGWFFNFNAGTPKTVVIEHVQMGVTDSMVLVFQYPIGTTVSVQAVATGCWSGSRTCLRTWNFRRVYSAKEVRDSSVQSDNRGGDVYYHDTTTGHVYFAVSMQSGNGLGTNGVWTRGPFSELAPFIFDGGKVNDRTLWGYSIQLRATCPTGTYTSNGIYCRIPAIIYPKSPCDNGQDAYDYCKEPVPINNGLVCTNANSLCVSGSTCCFLNSGDLTAGVRKCVTNGRCFISATTTSTPAPTSPSTSPSTPPIQLWVSCNIGNVCVSGASCCYGSLADQTANKRTCRPGGSCIT